MTAVYVITVYLLVLAYVVYRILKWLKKIILSLFK